MYMFNLAEKEIAISAVSDVVKDVSKESSRKIPLFIKALANYIEKTSRTSSIDVLNEVEHYLTMQEHQQALQRLLLHMVTVGVSEDTLAVRQYTTGEAARFFGVSIATIHNWIEQGRLLGVKKGERFKQVRIPENAVYVSSVGEKITVAEAAERYEVEQARLGRDKPLTPAEELLELTSAVVFYERKYGGTYKQTLGNRTDLTPEEIRDAEQWASLLRSIERRKND